MARITISDEELEELVLQNASDMDDFLDVDYSIDVRMGSAKMTVGELISLAGGEVVTLDRPSSGYVELVIGNIKVGEAEVLVRKKGTAARLVEIT